MPLIPCQREAFELPRDVTYLNCAYMSPVSKAAIAAGEAAIRQKGRPFEVTAPDFFSLPERARELFAKIIGADKEGVAIVPAASYGMTAATLNLPVTRGQEILVLKDQFPSNIYPWRRLAADKGATVRMLSLPQDGATWTEALLAAIGPNTAIVGTPNLHWTNGALIDLEQVSAACRKHGAALALDLTQSAGVLPTNLSRIQPDFAVAATYKFLMGPYGLGFMWVHPNWRDGRPVEEVWGARKGAEDFANLVDYQDDYAPGARRFDMGERSQFQLLPIAIAGMEQLLGWGIEDIQETLTARTLEIADRTSQLGFRSLPVGARAGHYLGLMRDGPLPTGLVQRLADKNVYVSVRGPSVRITPHLYNDAEDVDRFVEALTQEVARVTA